MSANLLRATILATSLAALAAVPAFAADATPAPVAAPPAPPDLSNRPSAVAAPVEIQTRPSVSMSLEEAINIALTRGWAAKLQELSLINSKETYMRARWAYLPTLTLNPSLSFGGSTGNTRTQSAALSAGISQQIVPIGATVSLNTNLLNISRRSRNDPTYSTGTTLSISGLSLLRLSPRYNLNSQRTSRISFENAFLSNKSQYMTIVQNVETQYLNLLSTRKALENAARNLQAARTTLNNQRARLQAGMVAPLDGVQAEITALNQENTFINSTNNLIAAEDNLRNLLGGGDYDVGIIPTEEITTYDGPTPNFDEAYDRALSNGIQYQQLLKNMETTEAAVFIARVNRIPSIGLSGSIGSSGSDTDWSPSARETLNRSTYTWSLGLSMSVPLPLRNERQAVRLANNALTQARINLEQTRASILVNVRNQVRAIETNKRTAEISTRSLDLAQQNYAAAQARYENGLITYQALLDSFSQLQSAQTSLLQSQVSLRNAVNSLRVTEGTSLERFNIQVETVPAE